MTTIRVPLWLKPVRGVPLSDFYYYDLLAKDSVMLRAPRGYMPDGTEFISVTIQIDTSGAAQEFIEFLRVSIKSVSGGRVSRKSIWAAWAERNGADSSSKEIAGVYWKDVLEHFRTAFNAGDLDRKRLEGPSQRVWYDYELSSGGDDAPPILTA